LKKGHRRRGPHRKFRGESEKLSPKRRERFRGIHLKWGRNRYDVKKGGGKCRNKSFGHQPEHDLIV